MRDTDIWRPLLRRLGLLLVAGALKCGGGGEEPGVGEPSPGDSPGTIEPGGTEPGGSPEGQKDPGITGPMPGEMRADPGPDPGGGGGPTPNDLGPVDIGPGNGMKEDPTQTSYMGSGGGVTYPPVFDIAILGETIYALDTSGCIRPSTATLDEATDCLAPSFRVQDPPVGIGARIASDGSGGFYLAAPQQEGFGALLFVDLTGNVNALRGQFDFGGGEANIAVLGRGASIEVYVLDRDGAEGYRIQVFNAALELQRTLPVITDGVPLDNPKGISVDSNGSIYVVWTVAPQVVRLTSTGALDATFKLSGFSEKDQIVNPVDIALTADGSVVVADAGSEGGPGLLRFFDTTGALLPIQLTSSPAFNFPALTAIAIAENGAIYVYDSTSFPEGEPSQALFEFRRQE
jgi:hypothetical protein